MSYETELRALEEAHIQSQPSWLRHFKVHWQMFKLALKYGDRKEAIGQIPRLLLAIPGSLLGKAPKGNVGSTRMGIFKSSGPSLREERGPLERKD